MRAKGCDLPLLSVGPCDVPRADQKIEKDALFFGVTCCVDRRVVL